MEDIKNIDYFKSLDENVLREAGTLFKEENYKAGENIFLEGDKSKGIYFVISGTVKIYKTSREGREQILKLIYPGESFNDVTVFVKDVNPASSDAVTDAKLYLLSRENMINLIYKHPELSLNIIRRMAGKQTYLTDMIEDLSIRHSKESIAKILVFIDDTK